MSSGDVFRYLLSRAGYSALGAIGALTMYHLMGWSCR
jgi:hypothetical protein